MLEDALLDLTNRGDIVIDPFLGSGSTLIAAEATGRVCRGVELDPLYVDVIMRRYQAATGSLAVLAETGETIDAMTARRAAEALPAKTLQNRKRCRRPASGGCPHCRGHRFESPPLQSARTEVVSWVPKSCD